MTTKEFNKIILNLSTSEVSSGEKKEIELYAEPYVVSFDLDCDIQIKHYMSSTYLNPEEAEIVETKHVSNIKVCLEDSEDYLKLSKMQYHKLTQEIEDNLTVVY